MPFPLLGEAAALLTSVFFSIGPTFFTLAGQRVGSIIVNRGRLLMAVGMLLVVHWGLLGSPLPFDAGGDRWFWLGLSGIIGLVIGDAFLFQAFVMVGTRLTMLIFSLSPILSAILAWVFLGETLRELQILAMLITLAGIAWVVLQSENGDESKESKKNYWIGLLFALGGAISQALGLITAKQGLGGEFSALSAHLMRISIAAVVMWGITILQGKARKTFQTFKQEPLALRETFLGAIFGPVIGVWFSLVAIQFTDVGIASTLMALPPVFLLPIGYFVFKEKITWQAAAGTIVALAGVAILFLV
ncbi:MAG: DMT family transporter [Chloroflexi bacterium]|nr:MAG: DMT family transporter [Chloroflexota bacterium]MBL1196791.1 DMT family transporter [Chloroflexota bacterium]NOH14085.1 DMT family transporter [Chloroflexota bacterium]